MPGSVVLSQVFFVGIGVEQKAGIKHGVEFGGDVGGFLILEVATLSLQR